MVPHPSPMLRKWGSVGSNTQRGKGKSKNDVPSPVRNRPKSVASRAIFGSFRSKKSGASFISSTTAKSTESTVPNPFVKAFLDTITIEKFSNFMAWFQFYDIVEVPQSPSQWYRGIDSMEMRGWIALGKFIASNRCYGLSLVVLDSICDRLRLNKALIQQHIAQLGNHETMIWTQVTVVMREGKKDHQTEVEILEAAQKMLQELRTIACCIRPTPGGTMSEWNAKAKQRSSDFLDVVINPQITHLRGVVGAPTGRSELEENNLKFLFEAMQRDRHVPLALYGHFPDPLMLSASTSSSWSESNPTTELDELTPEYAKLEDFYCVHTLQDKIRMQHDQITSLSAELKVVTEKLQKATNGHDSQSSVAPSPNNVGGQDNLGSSISSPSARARKHAHSSSVDSPNEFRKNRAPFVFPKTPTKLHGRGRSTQSVSLAVGCRTKTEPVDKSETPSSSPSSLDYSDVFSGISSPIATFLGLADPAVSVETPPTTPMPQPHLPRNTGSNNLPALATGLVPAPIPSPPSHPSKPANLPRNNGISNLRLALGVDHPTDLTRSEPASPHGVASEKEIASPRRVFSCRNEPGPHNSLLEYRARQVNVSAVQLAVPPYNHPPSSGPIGTAKDLIRRGSSKLRRETRKESADSPTNGKGKEPRKSKNIAFALNGVLRRQKKDDGDAPNYAQNF